MKRGEISKKVMKINNAMERIIIIHKTGEDEKSFIISKEQEMDSYVRENYPKLI